MKKFIKVAASIALAAASVLCLTGCSSNISAGEYYKAVQKAYTNQITKYDIEERNDFVATSNVKETASETKEYTYKVNENATETVTNEYTETEEMTIKKTVKKTGKGKDIVITFETVATSIATTYEVNDQMLLDETKTEETETKTYYLQKYSNNNDLEFVIALEKSSTKKINGEEDSSALADTATKEYELITYDEFSNYVNEIYEICFEDSYEMILISSSSSSAHVDESFSKSGSKYTRSYDMCATYAYSNFVYMQGSADMSIKNDKVDSIEYTLEYDSVSKNASSNEDVELNVDYNYGDITLEAKNLNGFTNTSFSNIRFGSFFIDL